jgi:hypothetical protein
MTAIELIPSAKRLITSLRDMGYDFAQAVADVVDNSIEAKASIVTIDIEFDGDDSWVRITDNGRGMTAEELREALRFGAQREYSKDDLGKFGLGLKTASMSQCQRLAVASRWNPDRADIAAYAWDLEHISRTNRWEILPVERNGLDPVIRHPLKENRGTVVLWQRLDRILGYKHPYGEMARKRLSQMCRELEIHLGMVFQAFLSGEIHHKRFKVLVNGNEVQPWDPFCRSEAKTRKLQAVRIPIEHEGVSGIVEVEPFVLPPQDEFSSPENFRRASGPANWNQQQGFYFYRAGRMIQSGGWSNLRAPDEHTKLARIAIRFSPGLDEAFKINVAKMRVQLPAQIRDAVREAVIPVIRLAREVYDRKASKPAASSPALKATAVGTEAVASSGATEVGTAAAPANATAAASSDQRPTTTTATPAETLLTFDEWSERLLRVATDGERPVIESALKRVGQ